VTKNSDKNVVFFWDFCYQSIEKGKFPEKRGYKK
jgi:hypothetical protein